MLVTRQKNPGILLKYPRKKKDILTNVLSLSNHTKNFNKYIKPLTDSDWLEKTEKDKEAANKLTIRPLKAKYGKETCFRMPSNQQFFILISTHHPTEIRIKAMAHVKFS